MSEGLNRIFGVETEFGCLVETEDDLGYEAVVEAVKDHVFHHQRLGAIDLHPRDEAFEPAFSGGFLINGGRLYVDAVGSHEEYATPECRSILDLIAADKAGHRIITRALKEIGLEDSVSFYNNSVDHFGGHTFGCHENYLVRSEDRFLNESVRFLYPFLVTRQIYAGVGRVGGHRIDYMGARPDMNDLALHPVDYIWVSNVYGVNPDPDVEFQLSQRADHIIKTIASRVRFNRALINPKWEALYSHGDATRLHLLFGEANQMEFAFALKIGTTCLMLDLIENHLVPERLHVADPLDTLRKVSRDPAYRWIVQLENEETIPAVDLHREYVTLAETFRGRDEETDWTLDNWAETLDLLEKDPMALADRLDWVAKRKIVEQYMEDQNLGWDADALHSIDMEYHNIDPAKSLFHALTEMGGARTVVNELAIVDAVTEPPGNTRAYGRAQLVRYLLSQKQPTYWVDWEAVYLDRQTVVELPDPFETYADVVKQLGK
ncbi:MAG: proteasome accessory factor PafA2 family protein [Armatimonadetes bacterium]|nr:proteasome accessory factor PafA2 family protein [Armatimonadota bacterium]